MAQINVLPQLCAERILLPPPMYMVDNDATTSNFSQASLKGDVLLSINRRSRREDAARLAHSISIRVYDGTSARYVLRLRLDRRAIQNDHSIPVQ